MDYSILDAKALIYDTVLASEDGAPPERAAVILDDLTVERPWGWVFFYNNTIYARTRKTRDAWIGPGPIFFNRSTAEIRRFGSGGNLTHEIYDYEMELAANGGCWCIWLTSGQPRAETIVKLKTALGITTAEARKLVPRLPHCLFSGIRRELDWAAHCLTARGISVEIVLEESAAVAQIGFKLQSWVGSCSLSEAYHQIL